MCQIGIWSEGIPWTYVFVKIWSFRMFEHLVPKTKMASTCCCVMANRVVGVGDPVGGGCDINIERGARWFDPNSEIVPNNIPCFDTVFHEVSVPFYKNF